MEGRQPEKNINTGKGVGMVEREVYKFNPPWKTLSWLPLSNFFFFVKEVVKVRKETCK